MNPMRPLSKRVNRFLSTARGVRGILQLDPEERRYLATAYDDSVPLPQGARETLTTANPRLRDLRERYAALDVPATRHVQWSQKATDFIGEHLRYFRGDSPYLWHYRELPRITRLKYFIFLKYVQEHDQRGLLDVLTEDGAFGCWHFVYPGYPTVSRDLLDSVNEIHFLERHLGVFERSDLRVLDIGAGYGRLAHRMLTALPNFSDYCCVDAIPESTFLCEYYLDYRELSPRGRVVPLDEVDRELAVDGFDLAVNIHSFSECTLDAVAWWIEQLARLRVPRLLVVPNDPQELRTNEGGGDSRDFRPALEAAGYRLTVREPVFADPGVRDTLDIHDRFFLFERHE